MGTMLYTALGIRGPGKGEWFSLLDNKLMDQGDLSIWTHGPRVTIAHRTKGVLASAKLTKKDYSVEYRHDTDNVLPMEKMDRIFELARTKAK